jgi:hypothetical protein
LEEHNKKNNVLKNSNIPLSISTFPQTNSQNDDTLLHQNRENNNLEDIHATVHQSMNIIKRFYFESKFDEIIHYLNSAFPNVI